VQASSYGIDDAAAPDVEGPDPADRRGQVGDGERLVDVVEIELVVQEVVEAGPEVLGRQARGMHNKGSLVISR
jgi:hypothetical protein